MYILARMVARNATYVRRIPKTKRSAVTRAEFNALVAVINDRGAAIATIEKTLDIQFQRIAQLQAELDQVRSAWRARPRRKTRRTATSG